MTNACTLQRIVLKCKKTNNKELPCYWYEEDGRGMCVHNWCENLVWLCTCDEARQEYLESVGV